MRDIDMNCLPSKRLDVYFEKFLNEFIFSELSETAIKKLGGFDMLRDVPLPYLPSDIKALSDGEGLSLARLAQNMTVVLGSATDFRYKNEYFAFLQKLFDGKACIGMIKAGESSIKKGDIEQACVYFRGALCVGDESIEAIFSYAMSAREIYLAGGEADRVGSFKAEAFRYFELATILYQDFADAYYYLGYAYLNMGLYMKADITWRTFLEKASNPMKSDSNEEDADNRIKEIIEYIEKLEEPVKIEAGINEISAGRHERGITILESYLDSDYEGFWPLHYYLGIAYNAVMRTDDAIKSLKRVLQLSPSHIDSMEILADIFAEQGDAQNEQKYRKKAELIKSQLNKV